MAAITAITGFQNLPNLTDLDLDGSANGCETVDVSGCTSLTHLDVSDMDIPNTDDPSLKYLNVEGCTALIELYVDDSDFSEGFPDLSSVAGTLEYFDADQCGITGSLNLSALLELRGFDLHGNEGLTSVTVSNSGSLGFENSMNLGGCDLTQTAVDNILVALSESQVGNGEIELSGGTNAVPSATGLAAIVTLELSGWNVYVNS